VEGKAIEESDSAKGTQSGQKYALTALVVFLFLGMGYSLAQRQSGLPGRHASVEIIEPSRLPAAGSDPLPSFEGAPSAAVQAEQATPPSAQPPASADVVVHVAGQVKNSGVYTLPAGKRVIDALRAAGGTKPDADRDAINLAARLEDGEQIYVPKKGSAPPAPAAGAVSSFAPAKTGSKAPAVSASRAAASARPATGPKKVNINRAGAEELDLLPGVGPATAQSILEYRKAAGGFARPEDLMNVKGIGPKKFAAMKQWVVVN